MSSDAVQYIFLYCVDKLTHEVYNTSVPFGTLQKGAPTMYDLRRLFLLSGMDDSEKESFIASLTPPVPYRRGDIIFDADSVRSALGVFLEGDGIAENAESFIVKTTFSEGSVFGAAAVFRSENGYVSLIKAKTDCLIQFITEEQLEECFRRHPDSAIRYISFLSDRIRFLNRKLTQLTDRTASARLYRYISDNADGDGELAVRNMAELSRIMSMGRTSLYRSIAELEEKGVLRRENNRFILL